MKRALKTDRLRHSRAIARANYVCFFYDASTLFNLRLTGRKKNERVGTLLGKEGDPG